jgi:hypothetical protein
VIQDVTQNSESELSWQHFASLQKDTRLPECEIQMNSELSSAIVELYSEIWKEIRLAEAAEGAGQSAKFPVEIVKDILKSVFLSGFV